MVWPFFYFLPWRWLCQADIPMGQYYYYWGVFACSLSAKILSWGGKIGNLLYFYFYILVVMHYSIGVFLCLCVVMTAYFVLFWLFQSIFCSLNFPLNLSFFGVVCLWVVLVQFFLQFIKCFMRTISWSVPVAIWMLSVWRYKRADCGSIVVWLYLGTLFIKK